MKRLLVPFDFSVPAKAALETALSLAGSQLTEVYSLHIIELPVLQDPMLMPVASIETGLYGDLDLKAREQFNRLDVNVPDNIRVVFEVRYGRTSSRILDYAKELEIDLIVMGTHGASGVKEVLIGSNTEKIVRGAGVPVLAVRLAFAKDQIKNIVFPNTFDTDNQEDLVEKIKTLQDFFQAKLHLVWINTPAIFVPDKKSKEKLVTFVNRFKITNYSMNIYNDFSEETGIANFAKECHADLIAMGTHGRKGIAHLVAGSVAEDVLNHIELPIWTSSLG
jgi:nucleotide-binding universal stress UspA family protein